MAFEKLASTWARERTLHRAAQLALVNKPAGLACALEPPGASLDLETVWLAR